MIEYTLDTNACIALINGTPKAVRRRFRRAVARGDTLLVSSVSAFELWYGVAKSRILRPHLRHSKKFRGVSECVILQTQSGVEIFTVNVLETDSPDLRSSEGKNLIISKIRETWQSLTELEQYDIDHFDQILEVYVNTDVYLHLLRLACGLESVVVGNETILGELKATILGAKLAKTSDKILNKLFDTVILTATRIRNSTQINKGTKSLGQMASK